MPPAFLQGLVRPLPVAPDAARQELPERDTPIAPSEQRLEPAAVLSAAQAQVGLTGMRIAQSEPHRALAVGLPVPLAPVAPAAAMLTAQSEPHRELMVGLLTRQAQAAPVAPLGVQAPAERAAQLVPQPPIDQEGPLELQAQVDRVGPPEVEAPEPAVLVAAVLAGAIPCHGRVPQADGRKLPPGAAQVAAEPVALAAEDAVPAAERAAQAVVGVAQAAADAVPAAVEHAAGVAEVAANATEDDRFNPIV